ncbi:MAG TPA: HesA/MoeB/ThiF family protein, partial [Thermodesulfobacteriota bacterium]|nr:HesA/MoeB/ThiF family protein [Thermodesulfobacteriota bacterium]
ERLRYHRQITFSNWGEQGQTRIKSATVFVAGVGGLGGPVSMYLAVAGVGRLRICDRGRVELSNLNRQILFDDDDIDILKVDAAACTLKRMNHHVRVECLSEEINRDSIEHLVGDSDIIVDCMDNFEARYVINDYAVAKGIPFVHAGIEGFAGQLAFIHPPHTPCLRCKIPDIPPTPEQFPVVGVTAGILGALEAHEVLKYLTGVGTNLKNAILLWNGMTSEFHRIEVDKDPDCPVCGKGTTIK